MSTSFACFNLAAFNSTIRGFVSLSFLFGSVCVLSCLFLRRVQQLNHYMLDFRARTDFKYVL